MTSGWECIQCGKMPAYKFEGVMDDPETDGTMKVVKLYCDEHSKEIKRWCYGVSLAGTDYIFGFGGIFSMRKA